MRYIDDGVVHENEVSSKECFDFKMSLIGHNNILFKSLLFNFKTNWLDIDFCLYHFYTFECEYQIISNLLALATVG